MKLNIELYLKVDFLATGVGLKKAYNRNGKRNTYGYSRLLVVLDQTSCRRAAATICPRPSPPFVGAEAPSAAEHTA